MRAHPSRAGAISAELFAAFLDELQSDPNTDELIGLDYLRQRVMDAAMTIAIRRAARKFQWAPSFAPNLAIDPAGVVHVMDVIDFVPAQTDWIQAEVRKVGKHAFKWVGL